MENLEQIITKQNNIREKINEYNRDFELYNKTYIEKFTELKTLKNELKYEKNSVQKDDDKIKILHFKIQSMSIEISSMANKVKEIQTNINDMKLEQEQLKEELLENPEVKIAVYAEEKRRVQELKDAKILEKREIDTLLKNNPKDISEIPNNIAEKISKDSLFQKYDSQISNFTELLNNSSNPRAKSSLENKIKTLEKEKEEFLISKIKEIASEYQNSIHIYEKELQTLAVKEAKVILDRHNGVYNSTSKVKDQKVFDDSSKTNDEKETNQSNNKNESQQTNAKSKDENDENTNNSKNDINDQSDNSDFKSKIMEEDIKNLPKKIGFFDKFKEKFSKVKEWLKDQFDNFKLTTVPMPEKNAKNDGPEVNTDKKGNTENKKDETETQNKEEKKQEKEKEKEQQEQKQNDDSSKNMNNTDTENNKEEEKTEKEDSKETKDNKEYTNSNYTQKEILDNEDIRKKIEDYMNNLEKKQKDNSNKEKENSTKESKEKEEI